MRSRNPEIKMIESRSKHFYWQLDFQFIYLVYFHSIQLQKQVTMFKNSQKFTTLSQKVLMIMFVIFMGATTVESLGTITNCANYTTTALTYCSTCQNGLTPNLLKDQCISCTVANCRTCQSSGSCGICKVGYTIYAQSISSNSTLGNTTTVTSFTKVCFLCNVANCVGCTANGVCGKCITGFQLANGACIGCNYPCATCKADGTCATCVQPTFFALPDSTGTCFGNTVASCAAYSAIDNKVCASCAEHFTIDTVYNTCNRTCIAPCLACASTVCSICENGYYLVAVSGTCEPCGLGCTECASATSCSKCIDGFFSLNGECQICSHICKTCASKSICLTYNADFNGLILFFFGGKYQIVSCGFGCDTCSPANHTICITCQNGFFNNDECTCVKCDAACRTCSSTSASTCLTCYPNAFLSLNTCVSCDTTCLTCLSATARTSCVTCKIGAYLDGTSCVKGGCSSNCNYCSSATKCTQCATGYSLFTDTDNGNAIVCAQCIQSCRECAAGQPANCVSCGSGLYLSGTSCVACSSNCKTCTASGCQVCISGYTLSSSLTCTQNCVLPCTACSATDPTSCTDCMAGYTYDSVSSKCVASTTCNSDSSCVICPFGHALSSGQCVVCTGLFCQSCASSAPAVCTSCLRGYYLDSTCQACKGGCATCLSDVACLSCAAGYTNTPTSISGSAGFICEACTGRCLTCQGATDRCTSCTSKHEIRGWNCVRKFRFGFGIILRTSISFFYGGFFRFLRAIVRAMGIRSTNSVSFGSIKSGSVVLTGSADPQSDSGSAQLAGLQNALVSSSSVAGFDIQSASISTIGATSADTSTNLGLILGICIPVGILLILLVSIVIYKLKQRKNQLGEFDKEKAQSISKQSVKKFIIHSNEQI